MSDSWIEETLARFKEENGNNDFVEIYMREALSALGGKINTLVTEFKKNGADKATCENCLKLIWILNTRAWNHLSVEAVYAEYD